MEQQTKTNLLNPETWIRLLYMIVFGLLSILARMVVWVVAALQFLLVLVTGNDNNNLRDLGQGASKWTYQAFLFVTFNSDEKPFPFSDWPEIDSTEIDSTEIDSSEIDSSEINSPETDKNEEREASAELASDTEGNTSEPADIDDVPAFVDNAEERTGENLDTSKPVADEEVKG